jgi:CBS domain protein
MNIVLVFLEILLLLCCAAFFSGAETAVTAVSRAEYRSLKKSSRKGAQRLARLVEIKDKVVTAALIGTNFVNTLNSSLITAFTLNVFGAQAVPAATAVITVLIIILAEIFPKALAAERAKQIGQAASLPLLLCYTVLRPIIAVFSLLTRGVLAIFSSRAQDVPLVLQDKDLQLLVHIGQEDGALAAGEEALLRKAVLLQDVKLRNIMTQRTAITSLDSEATFPQVVAQFRTSRFSRLPVYNAQTKSITGIVHYKDMLFALQKNRQPELTALVRPALFIPEGASLFSVIKAMNTHAHNMAIIIDEHGGVSGLITMDDIIAAVFTNVQDEYGGAKNNPLRNVRFINTSKLSIPGALRLEDCNELLHTDFHSDYYDTIGGFLLEKWGYLPHTNDVIMCGRMKFTAAQIIDRRIDTIIVDLSVGRI